MFHMQFIPVSELKYFDHLYYIFITVVYFVFDLCLFLEGWPCGEVEVF